MNMTEAVDSNGFSQKMRLQNGSNLQDGCQQEIFYGTKALA